MATINDINLPSESESEDEDFVDTEPPESDTSDEDGGKEKPSAKSQQEKISESIRAAKLLKIYEETQDEAVKSYKHEATVDEKDPLLHFHRRMPPEPKRNTNINDLHNYVQRGLGECRSTTPIDYRSMSRSYDGDTLCKSKIDEILDAIHTNTYQVKIERTVRFAGQTFTISENAVRGSKKHKKLMMEAEKHKSLGGAMSGLDELTKQLDTTQSVTSVRKSQNDWATYKEAANLEDELSQSRKDGYLQKQIFLRETDKNIQQRESELKRRRVN